MSRPYFILDVFTDVPLHGNPLAVVLEADGLDADRMQAIAREFNLSETVFVLSPRDAVNSARIRIFTPARELPFAGHPTVGTAALLAVTRAPEIIARQDLSVVIEEEIGLVTCTVRRARDVVMASFALPRLPALMAGAPAAAAAAAALGLAPGDIGPPGEAVLASAGVPYCCVPVRGLATAAAAWPDLTRWPQAFGGQGVFVYTRETSLPGAAVHARMFAPDLGITEDPATGSAVAALAAILVRDDALGDGDHTILIEQGVEMERPSLITLDLTIADGALAAASIGGAAVIVAEGTLRL